MIKDIMNKDSYKIYKRLEKDINKNKPKLVELCKEYAETQNDDLLIDIDYYGELVYQDKQDLLLLLIAYGFDEEKE